MICSLFSYSWEREFVWCMDGLINWLIDDWLIDFDWGIATHSSNMMGWFQPKISILPFNLKFFNKKAFFHKILHFLCHINYDVRPWVLKSLSFIKEGKWVCLEATTATEKRVSLEVSKQQVIVLFILFCFSFLESFQVANLKAELTKAGKHSSSELCLTATATCPTTFLKQVYDKYSACLQM